LRAEIDEVMKGVYTEVNNGVYRCGFASTQEAYEDAYARLFAQLDTLTERLTTSGILVGDTITEATCGCGHSALRRRLPRATSSATRQKLTEMAGAVGVRPTVSRPPLRRHIDFEQREQARVGVLVGLLRGGEAAAVDAVVDLGVDALHDLVDLARNGSG